MSGPDPGAPRDDGTPPPVGAAPVEPFWSWDDLAIFLLLALPSLLIGNAVAMAGVKLIPGPHPKALEVVPGQFLAYLFWFGALWALMKMRYDRPFWHSLGWVPPRRWVGLCVAGGPVLAILVGMLGVALKTPDVQTPMKDLMSDGTSLTIVLLFGVTAAPICEELAFRGFMLPLLARSLGAFSAIVLTAIPFGLLHGTQYGWHWQQVLLITCAGMAFGCVRHWTGSTAASALIHATYNLTFFTTFVGQAIRSRW